MTATAPAKAPPKETWQDWQLPGTPEPEPLLTRAEFLDRVRAEGGNVSERSLAHWENIGVLPRPVRRWRDGKPATLYPEWLVPAVTTIRIMQEHGERLAAIRGTIRSFYRRPRSEEDQRARNDSYHTGSAAAITALRNALVELIPKWEDWRDDTIEGVEIHLRGSGGNESVLDFSDAVRFALHAPRE